MTIKIFNQLYKIFFLEIYKYIEKLNIMKKDDYCYLDYVKRQKSHKNKIFEFQELNYKLI